MVGEDCIGTAGVMVHDSDKPSREIRPAIHEADRGASSKEMRKYCSNFDSV